MGQKRRQHNIRTKNRSIMGTAMAILGPFIMNCVKRRYSSPQYSKLPFSRKTQLSSLELHKSKHLCQQQSSSRHFSRVRHLQDQKVRNLLSGFQFSLLFCLCCCCGRFSVHHLMPANVRKKAWASFHYRGYSQSKRQWSYWPLATEIKRLNSETSETNL